MVYFQKVFPFRFVKQVLSMFCSINNEIPGLDDIRSFVLDKEARGLDKSKYRISMFFTTSKAVRTSGISVLCDCKRNITRTISEITSFPFGFILELSPQETESVAGVDITELSECGYDEVGEVKLPLCVLDVAGVFPGDYRSREQIVKDMEQCTVSPDGA